MTRHRAMPALLFRPDIASGWLRALRVAIDETAAALCRSHWQGAPVRVRAAAPARPMRPR